MASAELVKLRRRQTKVVVKAESASAASDSPAGAELVKEVKIKKSRQRKVTAKAEGNPTLPVPTEVLSEVKIRKPRERKMTAKARANLEPNMPASSELLAEVRVKRSRQRKVSGKAAADVAGTVVKEASDISLGPEADPLDIKIDPAILDKHCLGEIFSRLSSGLLLHAEVNRVWEIWVHTATLSMSFLIPSTRAILSAGSKLVMTSRCNT